MAYFAYAHAIMGALYCGRDRWFLNTNQARKTFTYISPMTPEPMTADYRAIVRYPGDLDVA